MRCPGLQGLRHGTVYLIVWFVDIALLLCLVCFYVSQRYDRRIDGRLSDYQRLMDQAYEVVKKISDRDWLPGLQTIGFSDGDHRWMSMGNQIFGSCASCEDKWQWVRDSQSEVYVLNAYYDVRYEKLNGSTDAAVKILTMAADSLDAQLYCYFWNESSDKRLVVSGQAKVMWLQHWDAQLGYYAPYLVTCKFPYSQKPYLKYVALETDSQHSDVSNTLLIRNIDSTSSDVPSGIVVCVKGLDYSDDYSLRLIEWIEANYVLGANKIAMYSYRLHKNMQKVLDYYNSSTSVNFEHIPISLPGNQPSGEYQISGFNQRNKLQKRRNEIIPYNDCVLRHMKSHVYALLVDVDELVVPVEQNTWQEMIDAYLLSVGKNEKSFTALSVRNAFYFSNLANNVSFDESPGMHMMNHRLRSNVMSAELGYVKSFFVIGNVEVVFNHYPVEALHPNAEGHVRLPVTVAIKNHYRDGCPPDLNGDCDTYYADTVIDFNLQRYAGVLCQRFNQTAKYLSLL